MITSNVFEEKRKPGDIDLVLEICNILALMNHPRPDNWIGDSTVREAIGAAPKLQRFLINRYWRVQLGLCSVSTTRERFCLVDTGSDADYLKIFRDAIAPSIINLKLAF